MQNLLVKPLDLAACLAAFAGLALVQGKLERSATLFGASDGICAAIHTRIQPDDHYWCDGNLAELLNKMDAVAFEKTRTKGRAMDYDQAIDYALAGT